VSDVALPSEAQNLAKQTTIRDKLLRSFSALLGDAIKHCSRSEGSNQ
jgi:hypothetical protein